MTDTNKETASSPLKKWLGLFFVVLTAGLIGLFYYKKWYRFFAVSNIIALREYFLQFGLITPIVIIAVCLVFSIFFLPTTVFAVLSGYMYGTVRGSVISWLAISLGMFISFLISRYLFHGAFSRRFGSAKMVQYLEKKLDSNQFLTVLLLRLIIVVPYNMQNYAYGLTKIKWRTYLFASIPGVLPAVIMNARIGSMISLLGSENVSKEMLGINFIVTLGLALAFFAAITLGKILYKRMERKMEKGSDAGKAEKTAG